MLYGSTLKNNTHECMQYNAPIPRLLAKQPAFTGKLASIVL